jgi:cytochrome c oxidase subunit 3
LFFSFYWVMTGVHAVHVTGGLAAVTRLLIASREQPLWLSGSGSEEATALYWHLVDVIWIVLYPLLYLGGRTHG